MKTMRSLTLKMLLKTYQRQSFQRSEGTQGR